jgi:thiol-disulfide isomerase/thioredoxin
MKLPPLLKAPQIRQFHLATDTQPIDVPAPAESSAGPAFWGLLILLVAATATLIVLQAKRPKPANPYSGWPLPPIEAAGWINSDAPLKSDDLRGKVVLVDFWASDCMPCLHHIPELIQIHKRFRDRGVQFVGLSHENGQQAEHLKALVETRPGLDWPVGYGAQMAYEALDITGTPTYFLYDRTGRSTWGGHSLDGLEDALIAALAAK